MWSLLLQGYVFDVSLKSLAHSAMLVKVTVLLPSAGPSGLNSTPFMSKCGLDHRLIGRQPHSQQLARVHCTLTAMLVHALGQRGAGYAGRANTMFMDEGHENRGCRCGTFEEVFSSAFAFALAVPQGECLHCGRTACTRRLKSHPLLPGDETGLIWCICASASRF